MISKYASMDIPNTCWVFIVSLDVYAWQRIVDLLHVCRIYRVMCADVAKSVFNSGFVYVHKWRACGLCLCSF